MERHRDTAGNLFFEGVARLCCDGMGFHAAARVSSLAQAGEVLVTSTVRESVVGSIFRFKDRGEHEQRGVPGNWHLVAVDI